MAKTKNYDDFIGESPEQFEQKCLCVICVDTSGSMNGGYGATSPIDELNKGLQAFKDEMLNDAVLSDRLEVAIIEFNSNVYTTEPALVQNLNIPRMTASGSTNLTAALDECVNLVDARKAWYKNTGQPYYRPWIIVITDGGPDDAYSAKMSASKIALGVNNKQYTFLPIGVEGADMNFLQEISCGIPAMKLDGLKFSAFFQWLSSNGFLTLWV